ncbi:MAG: helix-turn-helix domain-containing protein [Candidatus Nitrospinota bacterium M3_3B_026]
MGNADGVSASSLKKVLSLLEALYAAGDTASAVNLFFDEIGALVPHETAVYFPLDLKRGGLPSCGGHVCKNMDDGGKSSVLYGARYGAMDPLVKLGAQSLNCALKNTDITPMSRIMDGELYCDFLKPLGLAYVIAAALSSNGMPIGGISLHRPPGSKDFTDSEKAVLTLLAPHLARAIHNHESREIGLDITARLGLGEENGAAGASGLITRREAEVAALAARGLKNREIAETLFIAEQTVKDHLLSIYRKTGVNSRSALVARLFSR